MITFSVQSGSCGNCYYVESRGVRVLFDAGVSWRCAAERIRSRGGSTDGIRATFISHDHSDHFSCAGTYHRLTKAPLFMTTGTADSIGDRVGKVRPGGIQSFEAGDCVEIAHLRITSFSTPHDARDPVAFIVDDGCHRLGILTDLGHGFDRLKSCLATLDAAYLESNYDEPMLAANRDYPEILKLRIRGRAGHLENTESAKVARDALHAGEGRLKALLLCHLSGDNNTPTAALAAHARVLGAKPPADAPATNRPWTRRDALTLLASAPRKPTPGPGYQPDMFDCAPSTATATVEPPAATRRQPPPRLMVAYRDKPSDRLEL